MTPRPLQYLHELASYQRTLEESLSEVEQRLVMARMRRKAPDPVGIPPDPGPLTPTGEFVRPQLELEAGPVPGADLAQSIRTLLQQERNVAPVDARVQARPPRQRNARGSLVHQRVRVGSRWELAVLALARLRVDVDGALGARSLFPGFQSERALYYAVEASLHRVGLVGRHDRDEGPEIGAVVGAMVSQGWPYRVLPWVQSVRETLLHGLPLPAEFVAVPANQEDGEHMAKLADGAVIVVLALDPGSAEEWTEKLSLASDGVHGRQAAELSSLDQLSIESQEWGNASNVLEAQVQLSEGRPPCENAWALVDRVAMQEAGAGAATASLEGAGASSEIAPGTFAPAHSVDQRRWSMPDLRDAWRSYERWSAEQAATEGGAASFPEYLAGTTGRTDEVEVGQRRTRAFCIRFGAQALARKYKHASDFGVQERWSASAQARYSAALEAHVTSCVERYLVRFRGRDAVAHVRAGRIVWTEVDGTFVTGYRLQHTQLRHLWAQTPWSEP